MRKIEAEMVKAVRERRNWAKDNTRVFVTYDKNSGEVDWMCVELHGNALVRWLPDPDGYLVGRVVLDTVNAYPTRTTVSRLNALGFRCNLKRGEVIFR